MKEHNLAEDNILTRYALGSHIGSSPSDGVMMGSPGGGDMYPCSRLYVDIMVGWCVCGEGQQR